MDKMRMWSAAVALGIWCAVSASAARQLEHNQQAPEPKPGVALRLSLAVYGVEGAGNSGWAMGIVPLAEAEARGAQLMVSECGAGYLSEFEQVDRTMWGQPIVVSWGVEGRLVSIEGDSATVDIHWSRRVTTPDVVSAAQPQEWRGRLTLRDGDSRAFDFARVVEGTLPCGWFVPEIGVEFLDAPDVQDAVLRYDLWLVHRERDGTERVENLKMTGRQGHQTEYGFAPLHHSIDGNPIPGGRPDAVTTTLFGNIRGRARTDGLLELTVDTWRSSGFRNGVVSGGGTKHLVVRPAETIEIVVPPPRGQYDFAAPDGRVSGIHDSELFAGQSTVIRLTATRMR